MELFYGISNFNMVKRIVNMPAVCLYFPSQDVTAMAGINSIWFAEETALLSNDISM